VLGGRKKIPTFDFSETQVPSPSTPKSGFDFVKEDPYYIGMMNANAKLMAEERKICEEIINRPPTLTIPSAPVKKNAQIDNGCFNFTNIKRINLSQLFASQAIDKSETETAEIAFDVDDYEIPTIDLETDPDVINFIQGIEDELNEEEAFYDANMNLVTMDARYIQELERENTTLGSEVQMLRNFVYQSGFVF
jgi:hypothetical protein